MISLCLKEIRSTSIHDADAIGRSARSSNSIENVHHVEANDIQEDNESQGNAPPRTEEASQACKRKRITKFVGRIAMTLGAQEAADRCEEEEPNPRHDEPPRRQSVNASANSTVVGHFENTEATSKIKKRGERGKYKSYVVDMKIKGKQSSKLSIQIPDEIDRAIGENARHLVNECGRVVRTRAPLDVKNWQEAFARAGDRMWKEILDKFEIEAGSCSLKMQAFAVDTMQRLYRLWKTRLHYYYKIAKGAGKTDEELIKFPPADLPQHQ